MNNLKKKIVALCLTFSMVFSTGTAVFAKEQDDNASPKKVESTMNRIEGRDRFAVANKVMEDYYQNSKKVVLVSAIKFPDNISSTVMSQGQIPILYTYSDKLDPSTEKLLKSKDLDEVIIIGGEKSVSKDVQNHIENDLKIKVVRYSGYDRYAVNAKIVSEKFSSKNAEKQNLVVASGEVFADAINATSLAQKHNAPILLVSKNKISSDTKDYLQSFYKGNIGKIFVVGGQNTVSDKVLQKIKAITNVKPQRIFGSNRYMTSVRVANASFTAPTKAIFASGEVFVDALVAAPLSQKLKAPILLVSKSSITSDVKSYIGSNSFEEMYIVGGKNTVSEKVKDLILDNKSDETITTDPKYPGKKVIRRKPLPGLENEQEFPVQISDDTIVMVRGHYDDEMADEILRLLNQYRKENGLKALKQDNSLSPVAKTRATEIVHLFEHVRPRGGLVTDISNINGENIYNGPYTASGAMEAWKNSQGHNENMLREVFTRVKIKVFVTKAYYEDSDQTYDRYYAVQIFGI